MQENLLAFDHVRLNFSPESLHMLNISLAFIMFGVALEIKLDHFKKIFFDPKSALIGSFSQFILLSFITFILVILLSKFLSPTMALGMILVAACPGGNISNFITSLAKGNVATWWGIWHIIAGLGIAGLWTNFNYGLKKQQRNFI